MRGGRRVWRRGKRKAKKRQNKLQQASFRQTLVGVQESGWGKEGMKMGEGKERVAGLINKTHRTAYSHAQSRTREPKAEATENKHDKRKRGTNVSERYERGSIGDGIQRMSKVRGIGGRRTPLLRACMFTENSPHNHTSFY